MKIWVDDIRTPPDSSYYWAKSVNEAILSITNYELMHKISGGNKFYHIEEINLDHDAGDYYTEGGDYINVLNWMERTNRNYPIHIHSMNPVGVENMRRIIRHNNWKEL